MNDTYKIFEQNCEILSKASGWLKRSLEQCKKIGIKEKYSEEELDLFEAFISRYSRLCDVFINKSLRSLDNVELLEQGTIIDIINRAEKREIITSAVKARKMKELRNEMAHEYEPIALIPIFKDVLNYSPELLSWIENFKEYKNKLDKQLKK